MSIKTMLRRIRPDSFSHSSPSFYNTLSQSLELFELAPHEKEVRMYNCGPTVYGRQHIGNLSMFVFTDVLRRVLEYNGLAVKQVINITDFGHLSSDGDEGDDKMTLGLKREGMKPTLENMKILGEKYTNLFLEDIRALNVEVDHVTFPRASEYVPAEIAMIQTLEEKGYTYTTATGVYFDTSRFPAYGKLGNINLEGLRAGARVETGDKRNATDFILWKSDKKIGWDSPWGLGFPGWHIECSAMARACLGAQIDIHTGGIEHIPVHHNNEIAQSESATGKRPFSRFWMHRAHLQLEGTKIAKSEGNVVYLSDILERGFHPLSLRYLLLGTHYRKNANFTWEALEAAQTAFLRLRAFVDSYSSGCTAPSSYMKRFRERINDDLDTAGALSTVWEMVKDKDLNSQDIRAGLIDANRVLGLGFEELDEKAKKMYAGINGSRIEIAELPEHVRLLIIDRTNARLAKDWERSDSLRVQISELGYIVKDTSTGLEVFQQ